MTVDGNACCREDGAELGVPLLANDWKLGVDEAAGAVCSSISSARSARDPSDAESLLGELSRLAQLALPASTCGVLMYAARLAIMSKVGSLGSLSQGQLALAQTTYNISGLSWVVGIASAVQTFVGAAHGASACSLKGVILQRGCLVTLLTAAAPLLLWHWGAPALLAALHQDPQLAAGAARYIWAVSPSLPLSAVSYCTSFYLQAQRVVWPIVGVMAAVAGSAPLLLHAFVDVAGWGLSGAAATTLAMNALEVLLLLAVVVLHNRRQCADAKPHPARLSRDSLSAWGAYLAVAVPSCIMICIGWWAFDGLTLVSGLLPDAATAVAATGILFGIHALVILFIDGVGTAVTIRVANALGAAQPRAARRAVAAGLVMVLGATAVVVTPLWLAPRRVAAAFTGDARVAAVILSCLPLVAVALAGEAVNAALSGAIRGAGRQLLGSCVNFSAFWAVGLPVSVALALRWGDGVRGLWLGMACTSLLQAAIMACACAVLLDWQAEVARTRHLVRSQTASRSPLALPPQQQCASGGVDGRAAARDVEDGALAESTPAAAAAAQEGRDSPDACAVLTTRPAAGVDAKHA